MARDRVGATINRWERLSASLDANAADLPHLEDRRGRLAELLIRVHDLSKQQAALTASKQEVTKQLQAAFAEAFTLTAFLRAGIREKYGRTAEKLVEFGLRPFRGIRRRQEPEEPQPGAETPAVETSSTNRPA